MNAPNFLLDEKEREHTLYNFHKVLRGHSDGRSSWGNWDAGFISDAFSSDFLLSLRTALQLFWRGQKVQLWSERPPDKRNSFCDSWLLSLIAVKSEAGQRGWADKLTESETRLAARISTLELNGFAGFLPSLEQTHPSIVYDVMGTELGSQLRGFTSNETAPLLHDLLYHGSIGIQRSVAGVITDNYHYLPTNLSGNVKNEVKYAFKIVALHGTCEEKHAALRLIQHRLDALNSQGSEIEAIWISLMAKLDLRLACKRILSKTNNLNTGDEQDWAITLFAEIFGDRHTDARPGFDQIPMSERGQILKDMVIRAYATVRVEDDIHHDGCYTPGKRDHAETARSYLFSSLIETKSPHTLLTLYEFSEMPEFAHMKDRLKQIATEVAAQICEPVPMPLDTYRRFDQQQSYSPYDKPSLFMVMNNRIADFRHHLLKDEFSTIDTLRKIDSETELRRFIANWLNQNSHGAYTITQEAVKVSENRTDIRLQPYSGDFHATIELKLVGKNKPYWSGVDLKNALIDQLIEKYLSDDRCTVGCLLICMREPRQWQNPETKKKMNLKQTVDWLQSIADKLTENTPNLWVSVKGIDYSRQEIRQSH